MDTISNLLINYKCKSFIFENDNVSLNYLNRIISNFYVINLKEHEIKRNYIIQLMKKININFTLNVFDRVNDDKYETMKEIINNINKSELGCTLSHLYCLNEFVKSNNKNCVIFEDDIMIKKSFAKDFETYLDRNKNMNILLLGAHDYYFTFMNKNRVKDGLYTPSKRSNNLFGSYATYYTQYGAKLILKIHSDRLSYFDKYHSLIFKNKENVFICYPNLVITDISQSSIGIGHEHDFFSKKEKEYYCDCFDSKLNYKSYHMFYFSFFEKIKKEYESVNNESFNYLKSVIKIIGDINITKEQKYILLERLSFTLFNNHEIKSILF